MQVITSIKEMQQITSTLHTKGYSIGFVPTMGYLHEGHLTLMNEARKENDIVVLSIFVNPLQFGPNEDYETYPRDFKRDENLAEEAGVDFLFYPSVEEMYPNKLTVTVKVLDRVDVLCGKSRIGHFDGVATVLIKLFSIVSPNRAYFGMKDAQQVAVVDGLIHDFNLPIELVSVPTVREEDGLAKSSRNIRLTPSERSEAVHLYQSLQLAKQFIDNGERNPDILVQKMKSYLQNHTSGWIDYIEIYSYPELKKLDQLKGKIIIALAVKFSQVRLIDNLILEME